MSRMSDERKLIPLRAAAIAAPLTRAHVLEQDNIAVLDDGWTVGLTGNK